MNRDLRKSTVQDLLLDGALEFLTDAPEDEFNQLLAENGEDLADLDKRSKAAFDAAFKRYGRHKREAVKRGVAPIGGRLLTVVSKLPKGRDALLDIAHRLTVQSVTAGRRVSMQHRELTKLTDDDLRQVVAEMQVLAEASVDKKRE